MSQGRASSEWGTINPECKGPIAGWSEMSRDERIDHLGELAAKEQAIRACDILRLVLKLLCFNMMINIIWINMLILYATDFTLFYIFRSVNCYFN